MARGSQQVEGVMGESLMHLNSGETAAAVRSERRQPFRSVTLILAALFLCTATGCSKRQAKHDVKELEKALHLYVHEHGTYPTGTAVEVCQVLLGKSIGGQNPDRLTYVDASADEINAAGQFVDPWGSPYHITDGQRPNIYSYGPNRTDERGAGDDITPPKQK